LMHYLIIAFLWSLPWIIPPLVTWFRLAGHAPFMTTLREGPVTVHNDGQIKVYDVRGGFADVTADGLTVLAEHAVETV